MRGRLKALCAGLALALMSAASAAAHDNNTSAPAQALASLDAGMAPHAAAGYARQRAVPDLVETLPTNTAFIWPVYLRAGVNYRIYGACNDKCSDLDMEVYGADGRLVDQDVRSDDTPYVEITPTRTGMHYVRLWIFACEQAPCAAGARVVSGGTPTPRPPEHARRHREDNPDSDNDPSDRQNVVESELDDAGSMQALAGYAQFGDDAIEAVTLDSHGHQQTLHLDAGQAYVFVGACDQNCNDVDMEMLDPHGDQVAADLSSDDRPVVSLTPARAGDYIVRIWLANCSREPCFVGVRSFRRDAHASPRTWQLPPMPSTPPALPTPPARRH